MFMGVGIQTDSSRQEELHALSIPRSENCLAHDNIGRIRNQKSTSNFELDSTGTDSRLRHARLTDLRMRKQGG